MRAGKGKMRNRRFR